MFTLTEKQAAKIAKMWNEMAKDKYNVSAKKVHLVFGDNADEDLVKNGCTQIEVGRFESKSGNPATFYVDESDVTMEISA